MEHELKILILGALLHDIEKFAQIAGQTYSLNNENDLPLPLELKDFRSDIARIAAAHHQAKKDDLLEMCLHIADRLSSGMSEMQTISEKISPQTRLVSVFDRIRLRSAPSESPGKFFHAPVPLNMENGNEAVFPRADFPQDTEAAYKTLFEAFLPDIRKLKPDIGFYFYLESLISILEKYCWCVPFSDDPKLCDISLFDHAFSTAGIAQALFLYHHPRQNIPRIEDKEQKFLLLVGDLSGIQNYIFDISRDMGRGISKIFRARSFFLQALTRSVLIEIQRRTGVFSVCRLVDSGGKFILLMPMTDSLSNTFDNLDKEVQFWFRQNFKGLLTLNLAWDTCLTQQDFSLENFQSKMDEANESLERAKYQKLKKTFAEKGTLMDEDYDEREGGNCALCRFNASDTKASQDYERDKGIAVAICKSCYEQMDYIGKKLPETQYLIYGKNEKIPLFGDIALTLSEHEPKNLNGIFHVESLTDTGQFTRSRIARYLPKVTQDEINDKRWFELFTKDFSNEELQKERFIEALEKERFIKTFNAIAHKSKKEDNSKKENEEKNLIGRSLLGFLKADVDNLGLIFSLGLGEHLSAARLSCLSRMLNLFFSEYLVELAKKDFQDMYVVFAGGDDLFVVGPWHQTIAFAIELRKKLSLFCAENKDITLSAGILVAKPRLPMRKAAELAEEALKKAKAAPDKDSVCVFGETAKWDELKELIDWGKKFDKALEEKDRTGFSTAFLYRLLTYHRMYRQFKQESKIHFGRYLSLAHYDIGRNIRKPQYNNQKELNMLLHIFAVSYPKPQGIERLNIPLFYAINLNRSN